MSATTTMGKRTPVASAGGRGFVVRVTPGGDFSIHRPEPKPDRGEHPLAHLWEESYGFQDRAKRTVYGDRGKFAGMSITDLTYRYEAIEQLIEESHQSEGSFSPTLTLLLEKSNQDLGLVRSTLWREIWAVIDHLESLPAPPPTRAPRGSHGITSHGRRMVRSGCTLLQRRHGKECLSFVTCTLPGFSDVEMRHLSANFSEAVRQFRQSLGRDLRRAGIEPEMVHAVEIQEKRFQETGYAVPHLHIVFQGRQNRRSHWAVSVAQVDDAWERAVGAVLGRLVKMPSACNTQRVKKSAANYLAKYCSKGSASLKRVAKWGARMPLPTAWYGVTRSLRADIVRSTRRVRMDGSWVGFAMALGGYPGKIWWSDFHLESSGATVAMFGRVPPDRVTDLLRWLESASQQFLQSQDFGSQLSC